MKKKNIITRWSIIGVFFILSVISSFYLVKSYRNTPDSISRIITNINNEIRSLDTLVNEEIGRAASGEDSLCIKNAKTIVLNRLHKVNGLSAKDSLTFDPSKDSISGIITVVNKTIKSLDSHIRKEGERATDLNLLLRKGCCKDSVGKKAEILVIKSLTKVLTNVKGSLKNSLVSLKNQEKKISSAQKSLTNSEQKESKKSIYTWIFLILTCILVTAFIVSVILFSGVLRLFNKNKNKNMNDNDVNSTVSQNNGIDNNTEPTITFNAPIPELSYSIEPSSIAGECILKLSCDMEEAKIFYCYKSNVDNVIAYQGPITINKKCVILAAAAYNEMESKQLSIPIDPSSVSNSSEHDSNINSDKDNLGKEAEEMNNSNTENDKTDSSNSEVTTGATNITTEEKDGSDTKNLSEETKKRIRVFTNNQKTLGISFQGDNHLKATPAVPCQDCHSFTKINENWSVAIVSDGAGSKEHSDMGSNAVCAAFTHYLTHILTKDKRFVNGDIPNEKIWDLEFRALLNTFQSQLKSIKPFNTFDFESLAATIIILAYSPKGYLFAHVGDGRAGVKVNGEWKTILTPHKGEEANQTIFSTTIEFNKKPTLMMSGVFVPETKVEEASIEAFVLMSDGCEDGAWTTYQRVNLPDGDFRVEDVNQPRAQTLEQLMSIIDAPEVEQQAKLIDFITGYNKGFKTEGDDKTILFGKIK